MNNPSAGSSPPAAAPHGRTYGFAHSIFHLFIITCKKEVADPFRLFVRNKVNKKVGNLLYVGEVFLQKMYYSPCISLLNSSKVAVFSLSLTTFFRASVSLRSMLRSTKESMYSLFLSMSVA